MTCKNTLTQLLKPPKTNHVMLHFTDLLGNLKGRTVSADDLEKTLQEGLGFDGSSIPGLTNIHESDMIMKPDPTTFIMLPKFFYNRPVASLICDIYKPEKQRCESDPRYICQKTTKKLMEEGYTPAAAAELEFYLIKREEDTIQPVENHIKDNPRYFDISPTRDITETYRMDLSEVLNSFNIKVERQHHEVGSAQSEVTFKYSTPTQTSDNITRIKFAAKALANSKYRWIATFMPKPWIDKPGNGMHIHISLFDETCMKNVFFDPEDYANISQTGQYFIGGILEHAKALSAIVAPTVNSYKRLTKGYEAPVYICWSQKNRSALIRIPRYFPGKENEARIEFRCPDPLCNPYLTYSVVFEAGMDGVKKKINPPQPIEEDMYKLNEKKRRKLGVKALPSTLKEALEEWNSDEICKKVLGKETAEKYMELKNKEWKEYKSQTTTIETQITPWEIEKYLYA